MNNRKLEARIGNEAFRNEDASGKVIGNDERLWKEACKVYKNHFASGQKTSIELENPQLYNSLHQVMADYDLGLNSSTKLSNAGNILSQFRDLYYTDIRFNVFGQFKHSQPFFKYCSEIQKLKIEERNNNVADTENSWYETFKNGGLGLAYTGESAVQAWKNYLQSRVVDTNEYEESGVFELRNTALLPLLLDELDSICTP